MSMTGSLMGYNESGGGSVGVGEPSKQCKKPLKSLPVVAQVGSAGVTTALLQHHGKKSSSRSGLARSARSPLPPPERTHGAGSAGGRQRASTRICGHLNTLWSIWYGIFAVGFQAYIAVRCTRRFIAYLSLPWPVEAPPPAYELHACLALAGLGMLLLPILLFAAFLKLGNLANDGVKLGRTVSTCSRDPPSALLTGGADTGLANNIWRHGVPTAAFVHLCTAMCFLLPSLLMEARLIHAGFLPRDAVWRTDLDWVLVHRDRLVAFSFLSPPTNLTGAPSSYDYTSSTSGPPSYLDSDEDNLTSSSSNVEPNFDLDGIEPDIGSGGSTTTSTTTVLPTSPETTITTRLMPTPPTTSMASHEELTDSDRDEDLENLQQVTSSESTPVTTPSTTTLPTRGKQKRVHHQKMYQRNRGKMARNYKSRTNHAAVPFAFGNMTAQSLPLALNSLADLDHPENLNFSLANDSSDAVDYGPVTLEYLNYAMALGVYSARYPSVFWASNKPLATIFSILLVANSVQSLLAYAGMSVLYKVQMIGPIKVMPLLRHRVIASSSSLASLVGDRIFLLNPHVTLALFGLSTLLVFCSGMVMYLYAYGRFVAFLNQERERKVILSKEGRDDISGWGFMTQSAALCLFLALGICSAPLLYDYTMVYRGSLDGAVLACVLGSLAHLLLWLLVWLCLTAKRHWVFKLRVTIARATLKSARSVQLVTDLDLLAGNARYSAKDAEDGSAAPLLVVGNGRAYTVAETSPKKAIMGVIQKAAMERRARSQGLENGECDSSADGDEQIYWLRPKLRPSPVQSSGDGTCGQTGNDKGWLNKKLKQKVTFNDLPSTSGARNKGKARRGVADGGPDDDGDYATLRELPLVTSIDPADDSASEENKQWGRWLSPQSKGIPRIVDLLECVNDDQVTYYASGNRDLQPSSEGEPSPMLTPDPLLDASATAEPLPLPPPSPTSAPVAGELVLSTNSSQVSSSGQTPRCLRRADSGMPHDELTPRSDSSHSPPLDTLNGSNNCHTSNTSSNSETSSSGVHSNASSSQRRASSVEDVGSIEHREELAWRSCSLQRGTQPPTAASMMSGQYAPVTYNGYVSEPPSVLANAGCPPVILENPQDTTVVIRRRASRTKLQETIGIDEEPFGRSTNMRMTSFTEHSDLQPAPQGLARNVQASSTLPHYPTQPQVSYPRCSTMPLPHATHNGAMPVSNATGSTGSCGSVRPKQPAATAVPATQMAHTTLPQHHNGVRLLLHSAANPFAARRFPAAAQLHSQQQAWPQLPTNGIGGHHTFPQAPLLQSAQGKMPAQVVGQQQQPQVRQGSDRDSANFSMASSGDSDTCLPH